MKNVWTIALVAGSVTSAYAQVATSEAEPNESKATATIAAGSGVGMASGDTITGTSTGSSTTVGGVSSADLFRVKTAPALPGIYRHRLILTTDGTAGHTGSILGLTQLSTGITTTLAVVQSSLTTSTPPRMNQWYGFGKQEEIFYRVAGVAATTAPYTVTLETTPITPISGPTVQPGNVVISTIITGPTAGLVTDTDVWVYDGQFNAIEGFGNDDESVANGGTGATLQSRLSRTFTAGTYYVAVSRWNLANNLASPSDDDNRLGNVLDFPNAVVCAAAGTPSTFALSINGQAVPTSVSDNFGVAWVRFVVASPQVCDDIDFNNNDVFPEDQDVIDFFNVLAGEECATCNDIDFNNNEVFPEEQDVIDFFRVLSGGECPG